MLFVIEKCSLEESENGIQEKTDRSGMFHGKGDVGDFNTGKIPCNAQGYRNNKQSVDVRWGNEG